VDLTGPPVDPLIDFSIVVLALFPICQFDPGYIDNLHCQYGQRMFLYEHEQIEIGLC
jgi:hypothetical protein